MKNGEEGEEQFIEIDGSVLGMAELIVGIVAIGGMKGLVQTQKAGRVVYEFGEGTREVGERAQELLETVHLVVFDRLCYEEGEKQVELREGFDAMEHGMQSQTHKAIAAMHQYRWPNSLNGAFVVKRNKRVCQCLHQRIFHLLVLIATRQSKPTTKQKRRQ